MEEMILNFIQKNIHKKISLFLGFLLLIILFSSLDIFIEKICPNISYRLIIYLTIVMEWLVFWFYKKNELPENAKNKIGIVISINTENDKQRIRVKNDFIRDLNEQIIKNNLGKTINVILLNNHQTERVSKALELYSKNTQGKKEIKNWNSIKKSMRSHFYIYGDIKERQDIENKYFINFEAAVLHAPVTILTQKKIKEEFLNVWYNKVSFQEKIEFKGFKLVADSVFIAVEYIVGIAALVSGNIELALKLHNNLNKDSYFQKFTPLPPNLKHVKLKLKSLLVEEYFLLAKYYYTQNKFEECNNYLNQSLSIQKSYDALSQRSIIEFSYKKDPQKALDTVYESKKLAKNNGTWRYNEGFLLMYLQKYEKAIKVYKKIIEYSYPGEETTLIEIYTFIKDYLKNNPEKIQFYFVLGYLKYKKDSNYSDAYSYFDHFLIEANNKYDFLKQKAQSYKFELEQKMKIEK